APRPAPRAAAPSRPAPSKAAPPPAAPTAGGPKPTRPDNPLVERLRRRAGFNNKEGRPRSARTRATEPIAVGRSATPRRPGSDPEPE
ncbi:MAG: hypothetical protein KC501_29940, partial [Myxococcales bacterium]|nr:hypothetical protein [Myxococcales bacterium]